MLLCSDCFCLLVLFGSDCFCLLVLLYRGCYCLLVLLCSDCYYLLVLLCCDFAPVVSASTCWSTGICYFCCEIFRLYNIQLSSMILIPKNIKLNNLNLCVQNYSWFLSYSKLWYCCVLYVININSSSFKILLLLCSK